MTGYDVDYVALGLSHERGEAFKTVFLTFDKAHTGTITTKQLDALCFALGDELDPEELRVATASLENDKTGLIHFATFLQWWTSE
jgi:Ca2+-binding EF-hand superfamily protein